MNLMLTQGNALRIPRPEKKRNIPNILSKRYWDALEAWGKAKKDGASVTDLPMFGGQDE